MKSLDVIAAFLAGVGSVMGGIFTIKIVVKHENEECEKRFDAFREGLDRD